MPLKGRLLIWNCLKECLHWTSVAAVRSFHAAVHHIEKPSVAPLCVCDILHSVSERPQQGRDSGEKLQQLTAAGAFHSHWRMLQQQIAGGAFPWCLPHARASHCWGRLFLRRRRTLALEHYTAKNSRVDGEPQLGKVESVYGMYLHTHPYLQACLYSTCLSHASAVTLQCIPMLDGYVGMYSTCHQKEACSVDTP